MAIQYPVSLLILYLLTISASSESEIRSTYIIHLAPSLSQTRTRSHTPLRSLLPAHLRHPSPSHLYTYSLATYGYAALLTPSQARYLESHPSILSIQPDQVRYPHTTHTPSFLKLSLSGGLWPQSNLAEETIVAVLDTGIWPERPCFACEASFPSPPSKWRGKCVSTASFNGSQLCSNKLIGAKFFAKGYEAAIRHPIDETRESRLSFEQLILIIILVKMKIWASLVLDKVSKRWMLSIQLYWCPLSQVISMVTMLFVTFTSFMYYDQTKGNPKRGVIIISVNLYLMIKVIIPYIIRIKFCKLYLYFCNKNFNFNIFIII